MYNIEVDMTKKLLSVEIKGIFDSDDLRAYITETHEIMKGFGHKEALILFVFSRMDPVTQENLHIMVQALSAEADRIKKIAKVEGKVVTRMQMRRMVAEVNKMIGEDLAVDWFDNTQDAMRYLFS